MNLGVVPGEGRDGLLTGLGKIDRLSLGIEEAGLRLGQGCPRQVCFPGCPTELGPRCRDLLAGLLLAGECMADLLLQIRQFDLNRVNRGLLIADREREFAVAFAKRAIFASLRDERETTAEESQFVEAVGREAGSVTGQNDTALWRGGGNRGRLLKRLHHPDTAEQLASHNLLQGVGCR